MKSHKVTGGGAAQIHVVETGNKKGRPILFIHGFSQCWLAWSRQLRSDLAKDCRLVAMDMRGHGLSDKPREGYADSKLWADDVNAVIEDLDLDHPVLCGWSYGPLVILDYVRHYGEDGISGLNFVGAITKLGSDEAMSVITPEFLRLAPGLFATDVQESVMSLESLLRMCFTRPLSDDDLYLMLGVQLVRSTLRPPGTIFSRARQRRSSTEDPQARIDYARQSRRYCETRSRRSAQGCYRSR